MYRVEIISNKSVEDDVTEALEYYVKDIMYTILPLAYGKGGDDRKMGTNTWPETNFVLVSYVADDEIETVKKVIKAVKEKFPKEGIKCFIVPSADL